MKPVMNDTRLAEMGFGKELIEHGRVLAKTDGKDLLETLIALSKRVKDIHARQNSSTLECLYHQSFGQLMERVHQQRRDGYPVGLKNISKCCYFNSLIQSYFFCPPIFQAVVAFRRPRQNTDGSQSRQRRMSACFGLIQEMRKLFIEMALTNKKCIDPSPLLRFLIDERGNRIKMGEERDLCQINMLLLTLLEEALSAESGLASSLVKELFFVEKVQFTNGVESSEGSSLGFIVSSEVSSFLRALKEQISYTVQTEGRVLHREQWIKRAPKLLFFHIQRAIYEGKEVLKVNKEFQVEQQIVLDNFLLEKRSEFLIGKQRYQLLSTQLLRVQEQLRYAQQVQGLDQRLAKLRVDFPNLPCPLLEQQSSEFQSWVQQRNQLCARLDAELAGMGAKSREHVYQLRAVFVHQGKANFGHYWVNVKVGKSWFKISDSQVAQVDEASVLKQASGYADIGGYAAVYGRKNDPLLQCGLVDLGFQKKRSSQVSQFYDILGEKSKLYQEWCDTELYNQQIRHNKSMAEQLQKRQLFDKVKQVVENYDVRFAWVNERHRELKEKGDRYSYVQNLALFLRSRSPNPTPLLKYHLFDVSVRSHFGKSAAQLEEDVNLFRLVTKQMSEQLNAFQLPQSLLLNERLCSQYKKAVQDYTAQLQFQQTVKILARQSLSVTQAMSLMVHCSVSQSKLAKAGFDMGKVQLLKHSCLAYSKIKAQQGHADHKLIQIVFNLLAFSQMDPLIHQQVKVLIRGLDLSSLQPKLANSLKQILAGTVSPPTVQLLSTFRQQHGEWVRGKLEVREKLERRGRLWETGGKWQDIQQQLKQFLEQNTQHITMLQRLVKGKAVLSAQVLAKEGFLS